jgi:3-mercaptopyruvate sulfurtransferase SseA
VALKLNKLGIKRVRPLAGGLDAWIELEYPVEEVPMSAATASAALQS